jgi:hypothetical protein
VNSNGMKSLQLGAAGVGRLLFPFFILWLLGAIGLGWLVKSLLFIVGLLIITPVIAFVGLRWWLQRNLVQSQCPVCSYELMGLNHSALTCPSCGEALKVENGAFSRLTPPGTIDVEAVDVSVQAIDDEPHRLK